ncbi:hypothetical protein GCM10027570_20320 [Streptomonospora sediminis]
MNEERDGRTRNIGAQIDSFDRAMRWKMIRQVAKMAATGGAVTGFLGGAAAIALGGGAQWVALLGGGGFLLGISIGAIDLLFHIYLSDDMW